MSKNKSYARFIKHMNNSVLGLPESEALMPLLEMLISPEEAEFLSDFPIIPHTIEQLVAQFKVPKDELSKKLDAFAKRGILFRQKEMDTVIYFLYESQTLFFRSPYWSGKKDEKIKKIARLADQYFYNGLGQDFGGHPTMALRALPIEKTIQDSQQILPYEDVRQVVEQEDYICVAHCPCRQRKNLDPDSLSCKHETRNCLHLGPMAHYQVEMGMAEVISRDEAMEILNEAADAGLVHAVSNTKTGPFDICNCCSCCCVFLQSANVLGLSGHQPSNYMIEIRIETCKGCGLCTERCPMNALRLETSPAAKNKAGKLAVLETKQCIGCGVCAHKCPTQSLKLVHRQGEHDFPEDMIDMAERMAKDRGRTLFG